MKPITPEKSKLGFVGIGYMGRPIARRLLASGFKLTAYDRDRGKAQELVSVQNRYSFADREWGYVVDYCERNGIVFIPWFPLGAGKVAGEVLDRIAKAHGASRTQVALAWLLRRSPIMLPIPGTSSIAHLEENVAAASLRLTDEDYQMLSAVPELVASR